VPASKLPLFFGTTIYAFEGIGVVIPINKEMREPEAGLNTAMMLVLALYTGMGFFGYLKYGDQVLGSVTLNLSPTTMNMLVQLMFAVAIFLSYALQLYVPLNIIWPYLREKLKLGKDQLKIKIFEYAFRSIVVTATCEYRFDSFPSLVLIKVILSVLLAGAIPKLELFIALVGALSSSSLALIFPPLIDLVSQWDENYSFNKWWFILSKDIGILLLGVIGFVTGTYASLQQIKDAFT
jgi:proton-coupled amino acid transporter